MHQYLRRYVLIHGFFIGIGALIMAPLTVIFLFDLPSYTSSLWMLSFYTYCSWIRNWAWLLGALWLLVGICFLYGMVKRRKRALQPLLLLLGIHVLLILVGDTKKVFTSSYVSWGYSPFLGVSELANIIYALFHVGFTMVLLGKLFDETMPKTSWTDVNNAAYGRTTLSVGTEEVN